MEVARVEPVFAVGLVYTVASVESVEVVGSVEKIDVILHLIRTEKAGTNSFERAALSLISGAPRRIPFSRDAKY